MSDRSLRGMRLGSQSMETESNVQPAPRQRVEYRTADSGKAAYLVNGDSTADAEEEKPARTHWDMLMERRSIEELEKTLEERLEYYRNHFAV